MLSLGSAAGAAGAAERRVVTSDACEVLREIAAEDTVAVVWRRQLDPDLTRHLGERLPSRTAENGVLVWSHDHDRRSLDPLVDGLAPGSPLDGGDARDALLADVRFLLGRWFEVARAAHAYVSLAIVADASCHRLHVDRVGRRLLTTYVGAGTEWLDPRHAEAWRRDRCCFTPSALERVEAGAVLLMKGCSDSDDDGLVHRSPPVAEGAPPRLLLRVCDGEYHLARPERARSDVSPRTDTPVLG